MTEGVVGNGGGRDGGEHGGVWKGVNGEGLELLLMGVDYRFAEGL